MSALILALALGAALLHAAWNAFLRSSGDRMWTLTVMSFASTAVAIPWVFLAPLPPPAAWGYLLLSTLLQAAFGVFLIAAYRHGDLGQVYPIMRGTIPILVALGSFALRGEAPAAMALAGIVFIATGICSLAFGANRASSRSILLALACGAIIASYTTIDAVGVRVAGSSSAYTAWICLLYGLVFPVVYRLTHGPLVVDLRAPDTWKALGGGAASMVSYGLIVTAFSLGPAGPISALRETSVVFAVLIGWLFLGEALSLRRVLACLVVSVGAICLAR